MREYTVRLTVRTNDREDEADRGEPYYDDAEMGREISRWIERALEDRDDSPYVYWGEVTLREPRPVPGHNHLFVGDQNTCTWPDCELTWGEFRAARRKETGS